MKTVFQIGELFHILKLYQPRNATITTPRAERLGEIWSVIMNFVKNNVSQMA